MVDYKRVYTMTNENVSSFKQLYNFDMANVFTVLGSGDQYFTSLLNGACEVSVFDVNYTAWLFFRINFNAEIEFGTALLFFAFGSKYRHTHSDFSFVIFCTL